MFCIWITLFISIVLLLSYCVLVVLLLSWDLWTPVPPALLSHSCSVPLYLTLLLPSWLVSCLAETIKSLCHVTILQFVYQNHLALLPFDLYKIYPHWLLHSVPWFYLFAQTLNSELRTLTPNLALWTYVRNIWTATEGRCSAWTEANIQDPLPHFTSAKFCTEPRTPNPELHSSSATAS